MITFIVDSTVDPKPYKSLSSSTFKYSSLIPDGDEQLDFNQRFLRHFKGIDVVEPTVIKSSLSVDPTSIQRIGNNSFIRSALLAYSQHLHLVVRPDDVWLALITQFSFYVNANSEMLRSMFVSFDDKSELIVRTYGTLFTAPFDDVANQFAQQIAGNIKDPSIREWVLPDFTTTTNNDRVVGAFALMSTLKSYFDYKMKTECGLPKVTMMGTVDDWKQVRQRAERLIEFDLKDKLMSKWLDMLLPVLDNLVMSAEGKADTGEWIGDERSWRETVFELHGKEKNSYTYKNIFHPTPWPVMDIGDIARGYISCPLKVIDGGKEYQTDIYAGHIISKFTDGDTTITPQLDWCILLKSQEDSTNTN
ncbi:hypothetical protein SAMD00019534_064700 [Acytostelium subglobosum LB1]|uniref:hypothetical protein n=1 Tax=Acytostelium subglobosum LB1 TaxID=1410327 RepID=UPI0006447BCF|nr:hypothetical protein SAMD00019534_064700 [Acytostelium subglobosum LB1]GAM23295.1 hypothetical protein SAMD00019534_064700 [Acytostelium subglobosum LB1]|eukprot:XP_012753744.1 hypothetical protein SAMD00019534_064700 [Acytostelium subglobosum LB1]